MVLFPTISRGVARLLLLATLASVLTMGAAEAAPLRGPGGGEGFMGGGRPPAMGAAPFNVDPSPCGPEARQGGRGGGQYDCREPRRQPRGNNAPRHPGSNAFGLQFDPYGY